MPLQETGRAGGEPARPSSLITAGLAAGEQLVEHREIADDHGYKAKPRARFEERQHAGEPRLRHNISITECEKVTPLK
jgi:hypothetical protein